MSCSCCSPLGPGGGGGGGCGDVWGRTWFVSPSFAGATQNGSPSCPFTTAQAAVDAAADGDSIVLGFGSAGDVDLGGKNLYFFGVAGSVFGNMGILGAVTGSGDPTQASFTNVAVTSIDLPAAFLIFNSSQVLQGPVNCAGLNATQTRFTATDAANGITCSADGSQSQFIDCEFFNESVGFPTYDPANSSAARFDYVSARNFQTGSWLYAAPTTVTVPVDIEPNEYYGASTTDLTPPFGVVSLSQDTYYRNVSFGAGDSIQTNGFRLYVSGLLDLRGTDPSAVHLSSDASITGIDAAGSTQGTSPSAITTMNLAPARSGANGGAGGNVGAAGTNGSSTGNTGRGALGGVSGGGGAGGNASAGGGTGGASAGPTVTIINPQTFRGYVARVAAPTSDHSSLGGGGGGGGSGGATGKGGGGGASPRPSSAAEVYARCIIRDATTDAQAVDGVGPRGGHGGDGTTDGAGGGGGGGGGGTPLLLVCDWLMGESTTWIDISGGVGGDGGDGAGGAAGGVGGTGGGEGALTFGQRILRLWTLTTPGTAGTIGNNASGSTGGTGGAGGVGTITI